MTALKHMTDEDFKAMGIPMVCFNLVVDLCSSSIFSILFSNILKLL